MKLFSGRIVSICLFAGGWILATVRTVLDLVGYSTVPDDTKIALGRLDDFFVWLLSVPWWLPWGGAIVLTVVLMWVSWPRQSAVTSPSEPTPSMAEAALLKQQRLLEKERRVQAQAKSLSAYEIEQKLPIIDEIWRLFSDHFAKLIDSGKGLPSGWWNAWADRLNHPGYMARLQSFIEELEAFQSEVDGRRSRHSLHPEITKYCNTAVLKSSIHEISEFMISYRELANSLKPGTSNEVFVRFMQPHRSAFDTAVVELSRWREQAITGLAEYRQTLVNPA